MIHARPDYNRIQDPANLIGEDEPVFLLRATDKTAPNAIRHWAAMQHNEDISQLAYAHAIKMEEWQEKNGCKDADLPTQN